MLGPLITAHYLWALIFKRLDNDMTHTRAHTHGTDEWSCRFNLSTLHTGMEFVLSVSVKKALYNTQTRLWPTNKPLHFYFSSAGIILSCYCYFFKHMPLPLLRDDLLYISLCSCRNIAEALVSKGLATVIRYRQDDDQRSSHYDELLAAEAR